LQGLLESILPLATATTTSAFRTTFHCCVDASSTTDRPNRGERSRISAGESYTLYCTIQNGGEGELLLQSNWNVAPAEDHMVTRPHWPGLNQGLAGESYVIRRRCSKTSGQR